MSKVIRVGNQTSASVPVLVPFEYALNKGFDAFEFFPDRRESGYGWDVGGVDSATRTYIKKKAAEGGISLSVHAPLSAGPEDENALIEIIGFAKDIGATLLNIHPSFDKGIRNFAEALRPLLSILKGTGIGLSIENTPLTGPDEFNELFSHLKDMEGVGLWPVAVVGICLDIGHANLCGATRNDYLGFIDGLAPHVTIMHVHLHENYGDADSHLTLFTGPSKDRPEGIEGLIKCLISRGFSGSMILEQWPEPPELLDGARKRLIAMIEESGGEESGEGFLSALVEADGKSRSWREKLDGVCGIIADESFTPDIDDLTYLAIYLRFIASGEIKCAEDGRHFRPSHHARLSREITERLMALETAENSFLIRKILPYLPSHEGPYLRAEPLTRIRDIAHRNDIPKGLKDEIKHTLQNKLHRCAGPEDLKTSEALLNRITAPGADYSEDFVSEFRLFHEELKEFFGAVSLAGRLSGLEKTVDKETIGLIRIFLAKKDFPTHKEAVSALYALTQVRIRLSQMKDSRAVLSDIATEDFAFVLLSRIINGLDFGDVPSVIKILDLAVKNVRISGAEPQECGAIESELAALLDAMGEGFNAKDKFMLLRLGAALERALRLVEGYIDHSLRSFPEKAAVLGRLLGVNEQSIKVFAEGEIRGNLVFQLSKLVSGLKNEVRLPDSVSIKPVNAAISIKKRAVRKFTNEASVRLLGLFQKRFDGDDALLRLAAERFKEEGLGAEFHAATPDELEALMKIADSSLAVVHLQRKINLLEDRDRGLIEAFAKRFSGRLYGMVIHDQKEVETRPEEYFAALRDIGQRLSGMKGGPALFVEYAVFLDFDKYIGIFEAVKDIDSVCPCIDTGHAGLRRTNAEIKSGVDMERAVKTALPAVVDMIKKVSRFKRAAHIHLHDGHPLSKVSDAGVSDHVSFLAEMKLMFGPAGLSKIVDAALSSFDSVTFTLEIHPDGGRRPLGKYAKLFTRWADKTNAEKMNRWLSVMIENRKLLVDRAGKARVVGPDEHLALEL